MGRRIPRVVHSLSNGVFIVRFVSHKFSFFVQASIRSFVNVDRVGRWEFGGCRKRCRVGSMSLLHA